MKKFLILFAFLALNLFAKEGVMEIKFSFDGNAFLIVLDDNVAAREFYAMLPLEFEMSDYVGKEKIAHLDKRLSLENMQGYEPQIGDFFYFSPWGNIGIFYEKQPPYTGLIKLGVIKEPKEDLIKRLRDKKQNFKAIIEKHSK